MYKKREIQMLHVCVVVSLRISVYAKVEFFKPVLVIHISFFYCPQPQLQPQQ